MVNNIQAEQGTKIHPFKMIVGGLMLLGAALFMADGESKTAKNYLALNEGITGLMRVDAASIDEANNGKLIYISALAEATDSHRLNDDQFGVGAEGLRLIRTVEMYQWERYQTGTKNKRTAYRKIWSDERIDSSRFGKKEHNNPEKVYPSQFFQKETILMGAYVLNPELLDRLTATPLPGRVPDNLAGKAVLDGEYLFVGADPMAPEIGDQRIFFGVIETGRLSVIAAQESGHLVPWHSPRGNIVGIAGRGDVAPDLLFASQKKQFLKQSWFHRLFGLLLMLMSLGFTLKKAKDIQTDEFLRALAGALITGAAATALAWAKVYFLG